MAELVGVFHRLMRQLRAVQMGGGRGGWGGGGGGGHIFVVLNLPPFENHWLGTKLICVFIHVVEISMYMQHCHLMYYNIIFTFNWLW